MIGPLPHGQAFFTSTKFVSTPVAPGVRLLAADGSTAISRSASGIVDMGSNGRGKLLTPPSVDGWYLPQWDDNNGPTSPDEAVWVSSVWANILSAISGSGAVAIVLPAGGVSPVVTQTFFIKRGDNEPLIFPVTELAADGTKKIMDVTGWTGKFKLRTAPDTGTVLINQNFYISDADGNVTTDGSAGLLAYAWPNPGETDREGVFLAEFECHRADGTKKTYPTTSDLQNEYIKVNFVADLDDAGSH